MNLEIVQSPWMIIQKNPNNNKWYLWPYAIGLDRFTVIGKWCGGVDRRVWRREQRRGVVRCVRVKVQALT